MAQMGHLVPEPAKGVDNACMIHNMNPLSIRFMLKPKKNPKIQKLNFAYLWTKDLKTAIVTPKPLKLEPNQMEIVDLEQTDDIMEEV